MKKLLRLYIGILGFCLVLISCENDKNEDDLNTVPDGSIFETTNGYKAVKIGKQTWMAENLNIPSGTFVANQTAWHNLTGSDAAYCYFNNDEAMRDKYGLLYTYNAALNACPAGWHLPSDDEWQVLDDYLGASVCTKLKSDIDWNGTNESYFNALPGGSCGTNGYYHDEGYHAYFWSSTLYDGDRAWYRSLSTNYCDLSSNFNYRNDGRSVRYLKD